jgi:hypothetical protein
MATGIMAVSAATKMANQAKLNRQQAKAKLEEGTRNGVSNFWKQIGKGEDDVLTRGEYKELVEGLEPSSKPLDDGTMDEVSARLLLLNSLFCTCIRALRL